MSIKKLIATPKTPAERNLIVNWCHANGIKPEVYQEHVIIYGTLKGLRADARYINELNYDGNKKLENTALVKYIIWNIPAVVTCPYATELCKKNCYAIKAETVYPSVRPCRERAFQVSRGRDFASRMIFTLGVELFFSSRYKNASEIRFRIHESGDFYNRVYANSWLRVINYFAPFTRLVFDCYTKSLVYFDGVPVHAMRNFAFKSSVWADTKKSQLELIEKNNYAVYTADTMINIVDILNANKNASLCRCADCATCNLCAHVKAGALILCAIH